MSGSFNSTGNLTNDGEKNLKIDEYHNFVIKDIIIHIIPLSTSGTVSNLRIAGAFFKTFVPSLFHPSLAHIAIQLNLEDCKDILIIEYGQYLTKDSKNIETPNNFSSSLSKGPRTFKNENSYYYINKEGARITRFSDDYLKKFNEPNTHKLITNLITCQHYQIEYDKLKFKKFTDKQDSPFQSHFNNFFRVECNIKNKMKVKELIEHFRNKKWEADKYFVLSHNCQKFGDEVVKILKAIRKYEEDKVRGVEKYYFQAV
jgi:hypothetical protein